MAGRRLGWFSSVRARTTALAGIVVAVTLVAGSFGLLRTLEHSLTSNRDALSRARASDYVRQVEAGTLPRQLTDIGEDFMAQVVTADGTVLASSDAAIAAKPISSLAGVTSSPSMRIVRDVPEDEDEDDTEDFRVWVVGADTSAGAIIVFVGSGLEAVDDAVESLREALLVGVPAMLLLLVVGTRLVVGRALRPVEDIRAEVAAIGEAALDRRVPVPAVSDEIGRLARTMNAMLDRLEAASTRQRDFVADASHELQSPLAALRVQLEVALAHPEATDWDSLARDLLADSDRMERLVRDLLFLAQEDAGGSSLRADPVDLDVIVLDEVKRLRHRVSVSFDTSRVSAAPLEGNADDLGRLVRNLLDNAATHASSQVVVTLTVNQMHAHLTVCDDGPGIPAEQRTRVFDRFARVEGARARGSGDTPTGTGLGLSIARVIAERHHGSITIETPPGQGSGTCLLVTLPVVLQADDGTISVISS
jgi:signal transduction histidine kinase